MGVNSSSLSGRADVPVPLQRLQSVTKAEVGKIFRRYRNKVDTFAVDRAAFAVVLGPKETEVSGG